MLGGDVAQVTHNMFVNGERLINVYYFEAVDGTADLDALLAWFAPNVADVARGLLATSVTDTALEAVNLFDKGELAELALGGAGYQTGTDVMPSFTAASIRLIHTTAGMRSGWKRVGPAVEGNQSNGIWNAAYVNLMTLLGDALMNPLSPALATWAHVIVKRVKEIDVLTDEVTYRLPENQAELVVGYPVAYEASVQVTSQNSRKYGTP